MTLAATYYGANGWLLDFDGYRVLVDPWLRGSEFPRTMVSPRGTERRTPIPEALDLLLLTQGLADHAHPDTLNCCPGLTRRRIVRSCLGCPTPGL